MKENILMKPGFRILESQTRSDYIRHNNYGSDQCFSLLNMRFGKGFVPPVGHLHSGIILYLFLLKFRH